MKREDILKQIKMSLDNPIKGRNSMGVSENYYDPYYLIGKCFTKKQLNNIDEVNLNLLIKLANFASEIFY